MTTMMPDVSAPIGEASSIEDRLLRLQKTVQKATQEAYRQATLGDHNVADNDDPNASFHLGMELFGQEPSVIERNVQARLSEMEEELEDVIASIQSKNSESTSHSPAADPPTPSLSPEELEQEERSLRTKIEFLKLCSIVRGLLDEALTMSTPALSPNSVDRVQAAQKLIEGEALWKEAQRILTEHRADLPSAALAAAEQILSSLRRSLRNQKVDLLDKSKAMWKASVSMPTPHSIQVKGHAALEEAYQIMEVFSDQGHTVLQDILRKFTKQLYDEALKEALAITKDSRLAMSPVVFHETEERASLVIPSSSANRGSWKCLEWERKDDETAVMTAVASWQENFTYLKRILTFVADNILLRRPSLCKLVGRRLLGEPSALPSSLRLEELGLESCRIGDDTGLLMEPLVEAMFQTCLPEFLKPSEMHRLEETQKRLEGIVGPFLSEMTEKNLMLDSDCRLQKFTKEFSQNYVENRRCLKLNEVRRLLMHNDYHNTVSVGEPHDQKEGSIGVKDGMYVFKLQRAAVSETAQRLMSICRGCMDESVEQAGQKHDPESAFALLPATLYKTARESLDLYRAIIPVQYRSEIEQVPRTAAVFHNDCVFFAHHCQVLGIEYKARFPQPAAEDVRGQILYQTCIFVDMVPSFRSLAETSLRKMLDRQAREIRALVGDRVTLFGKALRSDEILAEWSEAEGAVNAGLYHIRHLSQAWKSVLSYDVFHRCICFLADVMFSLLLDQLGKATDISTTACQFVNHLFQRALDGVSEFIEGDFSSSQIYERFSTICKFMDMTLADIKIGLSKGVFRSVTGQELSRLISATFDDSPKRRELLRLLNSHHV